MTAQAFYESGKSDTLTFLAFLQHDRRNKVKHSWNIPLPSMGIEPKTPRYKTNA